MRPATSAETSPAAPIAPHRNPTAAGPEWIRSSTSTGTAMVRMPQLRLKLLRVSARPRRVALRTTYSRPSHAFRISDPLRPAPDVGSGSRNITAAAATNIADAAARAHSGPTRPIRAPATGAPTSVEKTWPLLSRALARSHNAGGASTGKSDRAPVLLSGLVSDAT